jgi:hypothetical protein
LQGSIPPESTTLGSLSSSGVGIGFTARAQRESGTPLPTTFSSRRSVRLTTTKKGLTSSQPSVWHLPPFLRSGDVTWDTWSPTSHLTHLAPNHISFHHSFVTLTLPASKTDQFRVGTDIYLAANPLSPLCPVTAPKVLFRRYSASPHAPSINEAVSTTFHESLFRPYNAPAAIERRHPHVRLFGSLPP